MSISKRVFLWTTPRSISTAFMFSVSTLPNVQTFSEPFCAPYYSENPITWQEHTLPKETMDIHHRSFGETVSWLLDEYPGKVVFVKDMAYFIRGRFDMLIDSRFKSFTHSFLIRNPKRTIYSNYKKTDLFKEWYYRGDIGYREIYELYCFLRDNLGISPPIIDADDLLANPEGMMEVYCNEVGLDYKKGMTKWDPKSMDTQEFNDQLYFTKEWHEEALKSDGFKELEPLPVLPDGLPDEVYKCIQESLEPYNKLHALRLKV